MPLMFENDVHFDATTDEAIIWGDEGTKRFRLVIPRSVLIDKYGLQQYFDHVGAEMIIQKHRETFEKIAQDAYDAGASEVIFGVNTNASLRRRGRGQMRRFISKLRTDATLRNFCLITAAYYGLVALALYSRLESVSPESKPVVVLLSMLLAAFFLLGAGFVGLILLSVVQWVVKIGLAWAVLVLSIPCAIYMVTYLDSGRCFP